MDKLKPKDKTEQEFQELMFDIKYDKEQFKDPETIGLLLYRLSKEREKTNLLYKQISERLEEIAKKIKELDKEHIKPEKIQDIEQINTMLSEVDRKIIAHTKQQGKIDAQEIQNLFNYKGKNAASARLNALYEKGILKKGRAGKKVLYWV